MIVSIVTFLNFNITFHYVSNTFQSGYYAKMCLFFPNFWTSNKPIENRSCQNKKCGMLQLMSCGPIHQSEVPTAWRHQLAMTVHYEPGEAGSWAGRDGGWKVSWVATGTGVHAGWCGVQSGVVRYTVVEGRSAGASAFYN